MSSRSFMAGAYKLLWDGSTDLGHTEAGFALEIQYGDHEQISEDRHGQAVLDGVFAGIKSMTIRIESLYWNIDSFHIAFPIFTDKVSGQIGPGAGSLIVRNGLAKTISLVPCTGAALAPNEQWDFYRGFPVDNISLQFSAKTLRRVPLTIQIFPEVSDGADNMECKWFTRR